MRAVPGRGVLEQPKHDHTPTPNFRGRITSVGPKHEGGVGRLVSMTGGRDLERLYEQHAPGALRLAYVLTGDPDLAQDLVQNAFVRIIGRLGQLRSDQAFGAYLRRTVVNLSYGTFRRRRVERAWLARELGVVTRDDTDAPDGLEERDELWHRLASVAPRQRAALVLRYYEDLSEEQAAAVLGCSTRALRSLTSRGLQALRTQESVVAR